MDMMSLYEGGSLAYLENFVNDRSPSGFDGAQRELKEWAPGSGRRFTLLQQEGADFSIESPLYGGAALTADGVALVHPVLLSNRELAARDLSQSSLRAVSTASGRTVQIEERIPLSFAKLHFPGVLGRVNRHLTIRKGVAGIEVSELMVAYVREIELDLEVLPEVRLVGFAGQDDSWDQGSWCHVERVRLSSQDYMQGPLVPCFAMFSRDQRNPEDEKLAVQLWRASGKPIDEWLMGLVLGIVKGYLSLVFERGLMPELNAQNLLFDVLDPGQLRPVLRDMGRVEKLLHVDEGLDMLLSAPYKVVDGRSDPAYARVRHSFSFDFKLCGYVIRPLVAALTEVAGARAELAWRSVQHACSEELDALGVARQWLPRKREVMGHPAVILTGARPYVSFGAPIIV